jgi:hypothetical protein
LNLLIRGYPSSSTGLLWKSPAGQKHKVVVQSVVRCINPSQTFKPNKGTVQCINLSFLFSLCTFLRVHLFQLIQKEP